MRIAPELVDQIVAHALEDPRVECCGIVAVAPGDGEKTATRVYRAHNAHVVNHTPDVREQFANLRSRFPEALELVLRPEADQRTVLQLCDLLTSYLPLKPDRSAIYEPIAHDHRVPG